MALGFQIRLPRRTAEHLIGPVESPDLDPLLAQTVEVGIEFGQQRGSTRRTAVVGLFPFVAQADGVTDLALHDPGLGPGRFQLLDPALNVLER